MTGLYGSFVADTGPWSTLAKQASDPPGCSEASLESKAKSIFRARDPCVGVGTSSGWARKLAAWHIAQFEPVPARTSAMEAGVIVPFSRSANRCFTCSAAKARKL